MEESFVQQIVHLYTSGMPQYMTGVYSRWLLMALAVLLAVDLVSYILSERILSQLVWNSFLKETLKRFLIMGIIVISFVLDKLLGTGDIIKNATMLFYIATEMTTITNYAIKTGLPVPDLIKRIVQAIKKK
ncbi:phage holin family protein [Bacillus sp. 1P06AnD]|uniref:phage holin family protein n=1 Tax=Bacillus sp. 1P06AnD TaxID=3132208 RepID=UPI00399F1F2F